MSGTTIHVIIRSTKRWFDLSTGEGLEVETPEELATLSLNNPVLDFSAYPTPLVRFIIAKICSTRIVGLISQRNHPVFDALSTFWVDDLNQVLAKGSSSLKEHVNYKDFADAYYPGRSASRENQMNAFLQTAPQNSALTASHDWPISPSSPPSKATHDIPASTLFKAAQALSNVSQIRSPEALSAHHNAARTWPFAADYIHPRNQDLPDPLDLPGLTFECNLTRLRVNSSEPALAPSPRARRPRGPLGARTRAALRHPGAAALDIQLAVGEAGPAGLE